MSYSTNTMQWNQSYQESLHERDTLKIQVFVLKTIHMRWQMAYMKMLQESFGGWRRLCRSFDISDVEHKRGRVQEGAIVRVGELRDAKI